MSQPQASFQIGSSIQDVFCRVFHFAPKILVFLFALVIGWFAATFLIVIVALGATAALNGAGIAAAVSKPVLYTMLLTCGAIVAIGVGGGLVKPMQARWERMLTAAERETGSHAVGKQRIPQGAGFSQGPRYLQGFTFSGAPSPGYPQSSGSHLGAQGYSRDSGYRKDRGEPPGTDIQDDPENYPGGQYM